MAARGQPLLEGLVQWQGGLVYPVQIPLGSVQLLGLQTHPHEEGLSCATVGGWGWALRCLH